jgi:pyridoxal phosphate enzyme (YggS family)
MLPVPEPPLTAELIRTRHDAITARLRNVAAAAGRAPDGFRIVAVTKGFSLPVVVAARAAGLTRFGENRVQEGLPKVAAIPDAEWHLVGRLQANKVRAAVRTFAVIHSVDSLELLGRIERIATEERVSPRICLQVNVADEPAKGGFLRGWFADQVSRRGELVEAIGDVRSSLVEGLMTIAPFGVGIGELRALFADMRRLRDELQATIGQPLAELSMGMTADAEAAVAEGATLVRIGTGIFGPRPG